MIINSAPQGSPEWFAARRGIPTASRFDQIITPGRGERSSSQDKLINALIAESLLPADDDEGYKSDAMKNGTAMEPEARAFYELAHATGPVREVGFVLADCGMFGGSPDALVGEDGGVEIKAPSAAVHVGYVRGGVLPADYKCQVHAYLVVTKRPWWDFFSYHRGLPSFCLRVEADEFTAKLAAELHAFCARYNEARAKFNLPPIGNP